MSYCRKEGKDIIIFATEEDLSGPSKATLLPENPGDDDMSHQGAILPNGDINWDCPCLGNLPNGPCGPAFREAFSCWVENKSDQDAFADKCFDSFTAWEGCLSENRAVYKSDSPDDKKDSDIISPDTDSLSEESTKSGKVLIDVKEKPSAELYDTTEEKISTTERKPSIAAAFSDEP